MQELDVEFANLDAYGVDGADERAAEAEAAWAAGDDAVAALGDLTPGPDLVQALTRMSAFALRPRARILLVGHWERQRAWTDAQSMAALAYATSDCGEDATRSVVADVARVVKLSEHSIGTRVALARHVSDGLDATWDSLNSGTITPSHLWVLANVTRDCSPILTTAVQDQVLPKAIARGWTPSQLADAARTAVMKLDPEGAEQRAREAKKQRSDVTLRPDEDMMAALTARTDAWTARQTMDEINRRADAMRRDGDQRNLGELRVAALAKALLGFDCDEPLGDAAGPGDTNQQADAPAAVQQPKRATALLLITLSTLLGGGQPGFLDGYGPITASLARRIAASDIRFRRLLFDPATGRPLDVGDASHDLSPQMRRWVDARDRTCRFPGCRRRSVFCDADHCIEWPVGQTTCDNCGLLCRKHHNFKTSKAWDLRRNDDDSVDWRSPNGFDWHVDAATYEEFLDPDPPPEPLRSVG